MQRTVEQVARDHLAAVASGDVEAMASDYAETAVLDRAGDLHQGKRAIEAYFRSVPDRLGQAVVVFDGLDIEGETATFQWHLEGGATEVSGTDVCLIKGNAIVHQRVHLNATDF